MSALVDRITEVLRQHLHATNHEEWDGLRWHKCDCGATGSGFVEDADHTAHVAERVAEALQLTEECGYQIEGDQPDEPDAWFPAADYRTSRPVTHRRWVSSWITEQEQP